MKFPGGNLEGFVIAPAVHSAGADVDHQRMIRGTGVHVPALEFSGGQPAYPGHIDPLGGGIEVARLIGPQVPSPQGAGELVLLRGRDDTLFVQAVAGMQPGGQLLDRKSTRLNSSH